MSQSSVSSPSFFISFEDGELIQLAFYHRVNTSSGAVHYLVRKDSHHFEVYGFASFPLLPFPSCDVCGQCKKCTFPVDISDTRTIIVSPWVATNLVVPFTGQINDFELYSLISLDYDRTLREQIEADRLYALSLQDPPSPFAENFDMKAESSSSSDDEHEEEPAAWSADEESDQESQPPSPDAHVSPTPGAYNTPPSPVTYSPLSPAPSPLIVDTQERPVVDWNEPEEYDSEQEPEYDSDDGYVKWMDVAGNPDKEAYKKGFREGRTKYLEDGEKFFDNDNPFAFRRYGHSIYWRRLGISDGARQMKRDYRRVEESKKKMIVRKKFE